MGTRRHAERRLLLLILASLLRATASMRPTASRRAFCIHVRRPFGPSRAHAFDPWKAAWLPGPTNACWSARRRGRRLEPTWGSSNAAIDRDGCSRLRRLCSCRAVFVGDRISPSTQERWSRNDTDSSIRTRHRGGAVRSDRGRRARQCRSRTGEVARHSRARAVVRELRRAGVGVVRSSSRPTGSRVVRRSSSARTPRAPFQAAGARTRASSDQTAARADRPGEGDRELHRDRSRCAATRGAVQRSADGGRT